MKGSIRSNRGKRKKRLSCVLALALCMGMALPVQADEVSDANAKVEEAKQKGEELEDQKNQTAEEQAALTEQLNEILGKMQETQEKMLKKEAEIEVKEEELTEAKIDENDQYESMKKRIQFMYENGDFQMIEVLLESETITEFLNKAEYVSEISEYDRDMLDEFRQVVKRVEKQEKALKAEYEELSDLQTELSGQKEDVQTVLDETNIKLQDLEAQIGENAAELEKLIQEADAAAERQRQAALAAQSGSSSYITPGPSVVTGSGQFTHPCPTGYVTSYFGEYRSPSDPAHKGMDFGTNRQPAPAYAAAAGTVVIAGWSNSAGNWVVINHGNGIVTKYMHFSALCVSAGQRVEKGQQIGMTGTTGYSSGIHLHYQVEVNGVAVDPINYLG